MNTWSNEKRDQILSLFPVSEEEDNPLIEIHCMMSDFENNRNYREFVRNEWNEMLKEIMAEVGRQIVKKGKPAVVTLKIAAKRTWLCDDSIYFGIGAHTDFDWKKVKDDD